MKMAMNEQMIAAEENLIIDFQFLVQRLLNEHGVSQRELADRIGVSRARLSQILGPDANPTLRLIARVMQALNEVGNIDVRSSFERPLKIESGDEYEFENLGKGASDKQKLPKISSTIYLAKVNDDFSRFSDSFEWKVDC